VTSTGADSCAPPQGVRAHTNPPLRFEGKIVHTVQQDAPDTKLFFPYRGLMRCAECKCQLTATRKKGKYDYYYCTNGKKICTQNKTYLDSTDITGFFTQALESLRFDDELIEIAYEAARERAENGQYDTRKVLDGLSLQLHSAKQQERKLLHSFTSGLIDENLYREEAQLLQSTKSDLEEKIQNYSKNAETRLATLELVKAVFLEGNKAILEFENSKPEKRRLILKNLLWNLEVSDQKVAQYKFKSPYCVLSNAPKNGDLNDLLAVWDEVGTCVSI